MLILKVESLWAGPATIPQILPLPQLGQTTALRSWDCHPPGSLQSTEPTPPRHPQHSILWELAPGCVNQHFCSHCMFLWQNHQHHFCCQNYAGEQATGACNACDKSCPQLNNKIKQSERPGFQSNKASVLFFNHSQLTANTPHLYGSWRVNIDIFRTIGVPKNQAL